MLELSRRSQMASRSESKPNSVEGTCRGERAAKDSLSRMSPHLVGKFQMTIAREPHRINAFSIPVSRSYLHASLTIIVAIHLNDVVDQFSSIDFLDNVQRVVPCVFDMSVIRDLFG